MKSLHTLYLLISFVSIHTVCHSQIVITKNTGSTILEIQSNNLGLLIPNMDSISKQNIASPSNGLTLWDNQLKKWTFYNNGWKSISDDGSYIDNETVGTGIYTQSKLDTIVFKIDGSELLDIYSNINDFTTIKPATSNIFLGLDNGTILNSNLQNNILIGSKIADQDTIFQDNIVMGFEPSFNDLFFGNVIFGKQALRQDQDPFLNTIIGSEALTFNGNNGPNNVALGFKTSHMGLADHSVLIGPYAGMTTSNVEKLVISNAISVDLIRGDFNNNELTLTGDLETTSNVKIGSTGTSIASFKNYTVTNIDVGTIASDGAQTFTVLLPNATASSVATVSPQLDLPGSVFISTARVDANGLLTVQYLNKGSNNQTIPLHTCYVSVINY